MRIKQLEYLIALKQHGSFLKTSQEIFVAQPAISAAIRDLEEELGYTLLNRNPRGVVFTEKGEQVLEKSMAVLELLDEIRALKYDVLENIEGSLRIGCGSRFCGSIVIDAYSVLCKRYPNLFVNVKRTGALEVLESISREEFDFGVIQIDAVEGEQIQQKLNEKNLTSVEMFRDEIVFVVGSNHPLKGKKKTSLQELMQYSYVTAKKTVSPAVEKLFQENGYQGQIIFIDDIAGMRQFLEHSNAITYMTKSAMKNDNEIYNNNFTAISITDFDWWCSVAWIHGQQELSALEQVVVDELIVQSQQYR